VRGYCEVGERGGGVLGPLAVVGRALLPRIYIGAVGCRSEKPGYPSLGAFVGTPTRRDPFCEK
jgi:hypothetical protein